MPSSYTSSLRLTLPVQGELSGSWGNTVNTGITQLVDTAVAGTATIPVGAGDYTLSNNNGVTDEARAMFLTLTAGTGAGARNVICPDVSKLYFVTNNSGFAQTVKTASGSGISVPNGASMVLRCDGTNVVVGENYFASLSLGAALPTTSGGTGLTSFTANGVVYASSSSALATGSALVFDGTNLGVGTSSPATKLHVNTGAAGYGITVAALSQTSRTYQFGIDSNSNFAIYESVAAAQRVVLDQSGNLGLGVTPSAWNSAYKAMDVGNSLSLIGGSLAGDLYYNAYINSSGGFVYRATTTASAYSLAGGQHRWYTAPSGTAGNAITFTQAMTLDASSNLTLLGSVSLWPATSGGAGSWSIKRAATNSLAFVYDFSGAEAARITSGGEFLVGTTNASVGTAVGCRIVDSGARLEVAKAASTNSDIGLSQYSTGAAAYRFYVGYGGTIYATSTTITAISDQRLKENIRDLDAGLSEVMALKPRKFDWKAGKGKDKKNDRGWIAQEFEQVFPDMVDTWQDPAPEGEEPYKAVNADLIPVLVKAIQEQQAIIEDLRARVAALEAK